MGKWLLRDRVLTALILLTVLIKIFSLQPKWVEKAYSTGFFVYSSRFLRLLFGWLPFSFGDLLYLAAGIFLLVKFVKFFRLLLQRKLKDRLALPVALKYLRIGFAVYLLFNLCWGLNYNRPGIAYQLGLRPSAYTGEDLLQLTTVLHKRLNEHAARIDTAGRSRWEDHETLFRAGQAAYEQASKQYPFLSYPFPSVKPSLYSHLGHYFGFTGYINPFTNEAQVKTTQPVFRQLFILNHEIAHQLGYAREDEASFVSFLACRRHPEVDFRYSMYYDLFQAANGGLILEGYVQDFMRFRKSLHPRVLADRQILIEFYRGKENKIEPFMSEFYDQYLRMNEQPKGKQTYDEVVALLIAYMKKYGEESL